MDEYAEKTDVIKKCACPNCGEEHETRTQALHCCPPEVEIHYYCEECGDFYDTRKEARECCTSWICGWCGTDYDNKPEAQICCETKGDSK